MFLCFSLLQRNIICFRVFLSRPLAGKRDIFVTIFVRCMCVHPCVCPSGFVRTIPCTIIHGFQNNLAQLLPLRRRCHVKHFIGRLKVKVTVAK